MNGKETDPRLSEAIRQGKPPMLRCWVNEHSQAILFENEAHVIIEGADGRQDWTIISQEKLVFLGVSQKGDALGSYRDAYVHAPIFPSLSDAQGYLVGIYGVDEIRMKVPKDMIVFARALDPIWEDIKRKFEEEAEGKIPEFRILESEQIAIKATDGSVQLRGEDE